MLDYYSLLPYSGDNEGWTVVTGRRQKRRRASSSSDSTTATPVPPRRKCAKRYWERKVEDKGQIDEVEGHSRDDRSGQGQREKVIPQSQGQCEEVILQDQRRDDASGGPFSNFVTLSTILSFLPLRDVKSARLVSRFWSEVAAPRFESLSSLELDLLSPSLGRTPTDFWNKVGRLPSSGVKLVRVPFRDGGLMKFMGKFGGQIKSLSVDAVACGDAEVEMGNDAIQKNYFLQVS